MTSEDKLLTVNVARYWLWWRREREREMFYLTTHSTHFICGYMASDIWLRTILIVRKEIRCRHIGYSYRLTARVLLYAPSHRQDNTYHGLCYTSHGALAGTRNSSWVHPMKDRSDDPSHHERTLYLWATSRSLMAQWPSLRLMGSNTEQISKCPMGRCKATTPFSFSLTSNRVTTNC